MSGDVQPRKRKDKRKKKEGGSLGNIQDPVGSHRFRRSDSDDRRIFEVSNQEEKIHIQNEHGIGGNVCVKIIFFCLFGMLVGGVALIYLQSQGSTDVDLPSVENSRFAEYFTGWLDDSSDNYGHESHENIENDEYGEHGDNEDHGEHDENNEPYDEEHEGDEEEGHEKIPNLDLGSITSFFGLGTTEESVNEKDNSAEEKFINSNIEEEDKEEDEESEESYEDENENDRSDNDDEDEVNDAVIVSEKNKFDGSSNVLGIYNSDHSSIEEDDENEEPMEADENEETMKEDENEETMEEDENEEAMEEQVEEEESEEKYDASQLDDKDDDQVENERSDELDGNLNDISDIENNSGLTESENNSEEEKEKENFELKGDSKNDVEADAELGYDEIDESEEKLENLNYDIDSEQIFLQVKKKKPSHNFIKINKLQNKPAAFENKKWKKNEEEVIKENVEEEKKTTDDLEAQRVAVKVVVGIALVIVAHLVLVQKWKARVNATSDELKAIETEDTICAKYSEAFNSDIEPVVSRRQTLVLNNILLNDKCDNDYDFYKDEVDDDEQQYLENEKKLFNKNIEEKKSEYRGKLLNSGSFFNEERNFDENYEIKKGVQLDDELNEEEEVDDEEIEEEEDEEIEEEEERDADCDGDDYDYSDDEDDIDEEDDHEEEYSHYLSKDDKMNQTKPDSTEIEDSTPVPPPRSHKRGAQEYEENSEQEPQNLAEDENINEKYTEEEHTEFFFQNEPEEMKSIHQKVGNEDEWNFRQELNYAEGQFENNPKAALKTYDQILLKKPTVIKALIGRAKVLDHLAEIERSNMYLKQATQAYRKLLLQNGDLLDDDMFINLADRCIERMRFGGLLGSAIDVHKEVISRFPKIPKHRNTFAVTYLMLNKIEEAKKLLEEILALWPGNGFALVHLGFILKTSRNDMEGGAKLMMEGIKTKDEGVIEGMFFFHLGDALNRLGQPKKAMEWYDLGVKEGLFLSRYQRSLYNVNRLKGQPWWTKKETTYESFFKKLEENWRDIRREGIELLNSKGVNLFKEEAENLKDTGDWRQLDLYFRGRKQANCNRAPITCSLVSLFKPAASCTRGQIKFSVMLPNTHVWPHCGPTNCRLRSHLGLVVPKNTYIRVAEEIRSWEEGKFIIFDDSFEHEVWHNGTGVRLVLIIDVWHPELTEHERRSLSPI